jgi:selenide,water dikinase
MQVLQQLPVVTNSNLLVGGETLDDAGVYALDDAKAVVLTVDVLTPIADDPYTFGQIAAANSLSDVYAMGGRPIATLTILGYPVGEIEHHVIQKVLAGVADKVREAGAVVAGGHTIKDTELKCGLAVFGLVHPQRILRNSTARPGDQLVLTKPLGIGIITTAVRADLAPARAIEQANYLMSQLNRAACEVMCTVGVNAATDVTGFGLLGHAWELAHASKVDLLLHAAQVPIIPEAIDLARQGLFPAGSLKNLEFMRQRVEFAPTVSEDLRGLLADAQTSGGLLIAVPAAKTPRLLALLHEAGVTDAAVIGSVEPGAGRIRVT